MQPTDEIFEWFCQYCNTENEVWIDLTIKGKQDFIEDCRICCRPNRIILISQPGGSYTLDVKMSDE